MTRKGILKRKIYKARENYDRAVRECTTGYNEDILRADLKLKHVMRIYHKFYPRVLTKLPYRFRGNGF